MPEDHRDPVPEGAGVFPASAKLRRRRGGFRIDAEDAGACEAVAVEEGWSIRSRGKAAGVFLKRGEGIGDSPGFSLVSGDEPWGWTSRLARDAWSLKHVVARDGRLFRIRCSGSRDACHELMGWQVPGAYLVATREGRGYRIRRTVAGRDLLAGPEVLILFAAEILDSEGWLARRR